MAIINDERVKAVMALNPEQRYFHSLKMIADTEEMYSLLDVNQNWELASVEGKTVFFVWSAKEYTNPFLQGQWKNSVVEKITIDEFNEEIASFLSENSYLISVFSSDNQSGFVVTVEEFLRDLDKELESYE